MEVSGQLYPQGKSPWYPLDWRLGRPQSRSGRGGEEKNSQPPPGIEPWSPDRPAHIVVTIPTERCVDIVFFNKSTKVGGHKIKS
jgi:hypothetical protein